MGNFNAVEARDQCIDWIIDYFDKNGKECSAVVGISGGKDSSVVAALCVRALGINRVIGVLMPQDVQDDIGFSVALCTILKIKNYTVNIGSTVDNLFLSMLKSAKDIKISSQAIINTPARIRMAVLYAVSACVNGRVANTCNLSEDYVGYATKFGDAAGDFSPLSNFTVDEVKKIGLSLGLPEYLIDKIPTDGLSGKTDEDNLEFTYKVLDKYIRTGVCEDKAIKRKIDTMHEHNLHKLNPMPNFKYKGNE